MEKGAGRNDEKSYKDGTEKLKEDMRKMREEMRKELEEIKKIEKGEGMGSKVKGGEEEDGEAY